MKSADVKKAVLRPAPGSRRFDWIVVVQFPDASFHAPVHPSGPPVVLYVSSFPSGFRGLFRHTLSSGSLTLRGDARQNLSPGSPGYLKARQSVGEWSV